MIIMNIMASWKLFLAHNCVPLSLIQMKSANNMLLDLLDTNLQMYRTYIFWLMYWAVSRGITLITNLYKTEIYSTEDFDFKANFQSKKTFFYCILTENQRDTIMTTIRIIDFWMPKKILEFLLAFILICLYSSQELPNEE